MENCSGTQVTKYYVNNVRYEADSVDLLNKLKDLILTEELNIKDW